MVDLSSEGILANNPFANMNDTRKFDKLNSQFRRTTKQHGQSGFIAFIHERDQKGYLIETETPIKELVGSIRDKRSSKAYHTTAKNVMDTRRAATALVRAAMEENSIRIQQQHASQGN